MMLLLSRLTRKVSLTYRQIISSSYFKVHKIGLFYYLLIYLFICWFDPPNRQIPNKLSVLLTGLHGSFNSNSASFLVGFLSVMNIAIL